MRTVGRVAATCILCAILTLAFSDEAPDTDPLSRYFTNEELEQYMRAYAARCSSIAKLFSIGKSALGRDIWALEISNSPGVRDSKPSFRYAANMHGDEPSGRQLLLKLAAWMCDARGSDDAVDSLLQSVRLFVLPTINPDGFAAHTRENSNRKDLNRDYPDRIERGSMNLTAGGREQIETALMMRFAASRHFAAAVNMHEGAVVVNYPWDTTPSHQTAYAACPDDATFRHLALSYARSNPAMRNSKEFADGITNGAAWYSVSGSMQDWMYVQTKCLELTLELSQNKWPPAAELAGIWDDNKVSLLQLPLLACLGGVRGCISGVARVRDDMRLRRVGDDIGQRPLPAVVHVDGVDWDVPVDYSSGCFHRPLAPGNYVLTVRYEAYHSWTAEVVVPSAGTGVELNITLRPLLDESLALSDHDTGLSWWQLPQVSQQQAAHDSLQRSSWLLVLALPLTFCTVWVVFGSKLCFASKRKRAAEW